VGDLVRIGNESGAVETIGVRLIKVRKFDGELLMVPAGEVRIFGNKSIGFARVIVEVGLSYGQAFETVRPVMEEVAHAWAEQRREILLEDEPQIQALTAFGESSVTARIVVQVKPGEQFAAERDLRVMLKRAFDERGVEIPFPQRTVHLLADAAPPAPPPPMTADDADGG
jgi:small conductance mechanosensitive channel